MSIGIDRGTPSRGSAGLRQGRRRIAFGAVTALVAGTVGITALGAAAPASASAFAPGNVVVVRVGTGVGGLNAAASTTVLEEYTPTGTLVQTIPMPVAASGAQQPLTQSGSATTEGALNRSPDGRFLTLVGYGTPPGTANVALTTTPAVPRVVGVVDTAGAVDTTTALDAYSGDNIRSAVTTDGTSLWVAGLNPTGTGFTTTGSTTLTQLTTLNSRVLTISNGQLYVSAVSAGLTGINSIGTGLPTSGTQIVTRLPGATPGDAHAFVLLDRDPGVPGDDTLYVAGNAAGLLKYSFNGTNWIARGASVANGGVRHVTGTVAANGTVSLWVSTTAGGTAGNNSLIQVTDIAAFDATLNPVNGVSIPAGSNKQFRGVAFAPVPLGTLPAITVQPASTTVGFGQSATLSVTATGAAPLSYQWYQGAAGDRTTPVGTDSPSFTTPALTATTSYWVQVSNAAGFTNSATATVTVVAAVPGAPTDVIATPGNASAGVSWTPPALDGGSPITSYTATAAPGGQACTVPAPATSCSISGLTNGTAYSVTVTATNAVGTGPASDAATVTPRTVPGSPTDVQATGGAGSAAVSWTAPADDGGSPVTSYTASAAPGGATCTTVAPDTSCTITGLVSGTTYDITVVATNAVGDSAPSAPVQVTAATVPGAPTDVTATAADGAAVVSWTAPANDGGSPVTSYEATASPGGASCTASAPATSCTITGLDNGTGYSVTVVATNAIGDSPASSPAATVTPRTVPGAPQAVTATAGDGEVTVSWTAPATDGGSPVTTYTATAQPGGGSCTVSAPTTSCTIEGLSNGTTYSIAVTAANAAGDGAQSDPVTATPATVPGQPTGVTATAGNASATVAWDAPVSDGGSVITSYTATAVATGQPTRTCSATPPDTTCTISGLVNGVTYFVTVVATNAVGDGPASATVLVTPAGVPSAPLAVTATRGNASAVVSWQPPADDGGSAVTSYTATATASGQTTRSCTVTAPTTSCTIASLTNGVAYSVTVLAVNAAGSGAPSAAVSVTPATTPGAPTSVTATVQDQTSVKVNWGPPGANGGSAVLSYTATATPGGSTCTMTVTSPPTATTCVITGLTAGATYSVSVRATNAVGTGAASGAVNVTLPAAPGVVTVLVSDASLRPLMDAIAGAVPELEVAATTATTYSVPGCAAPQALPGSPAEYLSLLGGGSYLGTVGQQVPPAAAGCAPDAVTSYSDAAGGGVAQPTFDLTILHNNDGESSLRPATLGGVSYGGAARFVTKMRELRTAADATGAVVTLNSGDNFLAGLDLEASRQSGAPFYDGIAQSAVGYDALAIGNHEFDFGAAFFRRFVDSVPGVPFVSANLDFTTDPNTAPIAGSRLVSRTVVTKDGEQIGVVGLTTQTLRQISSPEQVTILNEALATTAQREVDALTTQGVNKIILVSHLQGLTSERALVPLLRDVDVVIGGGGDELLADPGDEVLPNAAAVFDSYPSLALDSQGVRVPVVTTPGNYNYIGELKLSFDAAGYVVTVDPASGLRVVKGSGTGSVAPDPAVKADVEDPVSAFVSAAGATVLGSSEVRLDCERAEVRGRESNCGNLIADAILATGQREAAGLGVDTPQVGIVNGGGVRGEVDQQVGPFTLADAFRLAPFSNFVSIAEDVPAETFRQILEEGATSLPGTGDGGFVQAAGFRYEVSTNAAYLNRLTDPVTGVQTRAGTRVRTVTLDDGTPIVVSGVAVPGATVDIASNDFNLNGGDAYPVVPYVRSPIPYVDALTGYLTRPTVQQGLDGVITSTDYPLTPAVGSERIVIRSTP